MAMPAYLMVFTKGRKAPSQSRKPNPLQPGWVDLVSYGFGASGLRRVTFALEDNGEAAIFTQEWVSNGAADVPVTINSYALRSGEVGDAGRPIWDL